MVLLWKHGKSEYNQIQTTPVSTSRRPLRNATPLLTAAHMVRRMSVGSYDRLPWKVSPTELPPVQEMGGQLQSLPWPCHQSLFSSKISCKACLAPLPARKSWPATSAWVSLRPGRLGGEGRRDLPCASKTDEIEASLRPGPVLLNLVRSCCWFYHCC